MTRIIPSLALAAALAACSADPDAAPSPEANASRAAAAPVATASATATAAATPALAIEAEGLRLFDRASGSARPIPFGTDWQAVRTALAFRGEPGTGTNSECGAGPLDYASWPDGLTLYAQGGKFAGWAVDERGDGGIGTAAGIAPGSTRAQLEDAFAATFSQTTLGTEFAAGEVFGLLDGAGAGARITNMWGGVSCNFR